MIAAFHTESRRDAMPRTTLACLALVGVLFAAGCSNEDVPTPTSVRAESPTADSSVPSIIDQVIGAVASGETANLKALLVYHTETCTATPPGGGGPPVCATTEPDGTALEGITIAACEQEFIRRDELTLDSAVAPDLAFYGAYTFDAFPEGAEHLVIFERSTPVGGSIGMGYIVVDRGVIALQYGCGWPTIEDFIEGNNLGPPIVTPN